MYLSIYHHQHHHDPLNRSRPLRPFPTLHRLQGTVLEVQTDCPSPGRTIRLFKFFVGVSINVPFPSDPVGLSDLLGPLRSCPTRRSDNKTWRTSCCSMLPGGKDHPNYFGNEKTMLPTRVPPMFTSHIVWMPLLLQTLYVVTWHQILV